ncbi:MAG: family 16 glycosylhydrolase [Paludibacteraceae bacterium]|nr:family 16 glycosylhydrolase [Paludibacteraceae bacterium]
MNLFTARLTGKMLSTEQFEKTMRDMQERVKRWREIEKSPELAEYLKLKKEIEDPAFQARKTELKETRYKNTEEGKKMSRLDKLSSSLPMKGYKTALENPTFQAFLEFRNSEEFQKIGSLKERLKSSELRMYNVIYRSQFYKNYLRVLNSEELKELTALEQETSTEEFRKRNAFWADAKRWEHSVDYQREQRLEELAKSDDIKFYFAQREERIDWAELFRPAFEDDMSSPKNWKPGFGYANPALKDGHSRTNELQAYNGGKNTFFADGHMDIETREESKKALAWDEKKGFIEQVFPYTSDAMNTREAFSQKEGMFMAKVRCHGAGHTFFGLSSGDPKKAMAALYFYNGKNLQVGLVDGKKTQLAPLTGVLRSIYHVYTLRWNKKELIWYVNDMELLRVPNTLPHEKMFYLAQSFLPATEKGGEGKLKVQWARAYRSVE